MFFRSVSLAAFAALTFAGAGSALAGPTATKAWVSGLGTDSASCGALASPCRTFQYAHDNIVAAGGSIYVKDSAAYSALSITKSISIINENGASAIVLAQTGVGITIGSGAGVVLLQGLLIDGVGAGTTGISDTNSGSLTISNCTIKGFTSVGVSVVPGYEGNVVIADSVITNNGAGLYTNGDSSGSLTMSLSHDQIVNNGFNASGFGVRITGGGAAYQFMTIENSHIAQNGVGLSVESNGSDRIQASLFATSVVGNNKSINVAGGGSVRLEKTSVQAAYPAAITNSGSITSYGDNAISDGVTGNAITTTALQ